MGRITSIIISLVPVILLSGVLASDNSMTTISVPQLMAAETVVTPAPAAPLATEQTLSNTKYVVYFGEPKYYNGEINTDDLLAELGYIVKFIHNPVSSPEDFTRMDLIGFLFERALYTDTKEIDGGYDSGGPEYTVDAGKLAEYLFAYFGLTPNYLDKYKNGSSKLGSKYDSYDPARDVFLFRGSGAQWHFSEHYICSYADASQIYIDGHDITVKTIISPEYSVGDKKSADYKFLAIELKGKIFYRLISVNIYDDLRNHQTFILTLDRTSFYAPWTTVCRNGEMQYIVPETYLFESWSDPYPRLNIPPERYEGDAANYNENTGIYKYFIYNGDAYLVFVYYGIVDTYVYNIEHGTGHWMSGAEDLEVFYKPELAVLRNEDKAEENYICKSYRNFDIVDISPDHGYALLRRNLYPRQLEGEYLMRCLSTGEETYICDSYTRETIMSYSEESIEWVDSNHFRIKTVNKYDWPAIDVIFDGRRWCLDLDKSFDWLPIPPQETATALNLSATDFPSATCASSSERTIMDYSLQSQASEVTVYPEDFLAMRYIGTSNDNFEDSQNIYASGNNATGPFRIVNYRDFDTFEMQYPSGDWVVSQKVYKNANYVTSEGISVGSVKKNVIDAYQKYELKEYNISKISTVNLWTLDIVLKGIDLANTYLYVDNQNIFNESYPGTDYWGGLGAYIFILDQNNTVVKIVEYGPTSG